MIDQMIEGIFKGSGMICFSKWTGINLPCAQEYDLYQATAKP